MRLVQKIVCIVVPVLVVSAAHADPLANMSGKPVITIAPDGSKSIMQVGLSGTWELFKSDQTSTSGTYYWQSDRTICFVRLDPIPVLNETGVGCMQATFDTKRETVMTLTAPDGRTTILVVSTKK